jgi:hypothetical protein
MDGPNPAARIYSLVRATRVFPLDGRGESTAADVTAPTTTSDTQAACIHSCERHDG